VAATCPNATTPVTESSAQTVDAAVVCLVNHERGERGLPPLTAQPQLQSSAQQWTSWMVSADQLTHGSDFAGRIASTGYDLSAAGENIATGYPTPSAVVAAWMNSPDHCQNILDPTYRDIGTGVSAQPVPGVTSLPGTWTEDFGLSLLQSAPSANWAPANGCPY
jgi:uncharacterized protein YkwD